MKLIPKHFQSVLKRGTSIMSVFLSDRIAENRKLQSTFVAFPHKNIVGPGVILSHGTIYYPFTKHDIQNLIYRLIFPVYTSV